MTENQFKLSTAQRADILKKVRGELEQKVAKEKFVYVGPGAEVRFGTTAGRLRNVLAWLKEEGYSVHYLRGKDRTGTTEVDTNAIKVLTASSVSYQEIWENREKIRQAAQSELKEEDSK